MGWFSIARIVRIAFTAGLLTAVVGTAQSSSRLFMVGNSVTDGINYSGFETLVAQSGNTLVWGRNIILGAPLAMLWAEQAGFTTSPYGSHQQALVNYTWDAVTLQPFDRGISGSDGDSLMICNFMNEAKAASPDCQFYVYSRWPRQPGGVTLTATVWNQLWTSTFTGSSQINETDKWFDSLLVQVRKANLGMKTVLMMPVGDVFHLLNQKMAAGQVPGFSSIWDVYSDGIHLTGVGSYIVSCTYYATLFKQDPRGLSVPANYGSITGAIRDSIQSAAFQVVFNHPYSGATMADLVPVSSVSVTPSTLALGMLQSGQVSATVSPATAANKRVTWLSDNTGIAIVDAGGVVTGLSGGNANIIARTNDGGYRDTCVVTVSGTLPGNTVSGKLAIWDFQTIGGRQMVKATTIMNGVDSASPNCRASLGSGINLDANATNRLAGSGQTAMTLTQAVAGNEYVSFTIAPQPGKLLTIDTLEIAALSQNRTRTFSIFSSIGGFAEIAVLDSFAATSWDSYHKRPVSGHTNIPGPVEFRLYIHGHNDVYEAVGVGNNQVGADITVTGNLFTPSDTDPPSAPANLSAPFAQIRDTSVFLAWDAATDNLVVWGYNVYRGTTRLNTGLVKTLNFTATGLTSGTSYTFGVETVDFAGNVSTRATVTARTNRAPTAAFVATPTSGPGPLQVTFTPTGSFDPDQADGDYILGYVWDFGDGSSLDYSNGPVHTYQSSGSFTVTLRVVDSRDLYSPPVTGAIQVGPVDVSPAAKALRRAPQQVIRAYDLRGRLVYEGVSGSSAAALKAKDLNAGGVRIISPVSEGARQGAETVLLP